MSENISKKELIQLIASKDKKLKELEAQIRTMESGDITLMLPVSEVFGKLYARYRKAFEETLTVEAIGELIKRHAKYEKRVK